jgi:hypothetical protein
MNDSGMAASEIGWRLRRSPGHIERILRFAQTPRPAREPLGEATLRPIERCVLKARSLGVDRTETAARFRKSPQHISRVEQYANYKLEAIVRDADHV